MTYIIHKAGTKDNGLSLTGKIGKFTAPVANGYPLFKSPEDVHKAIRPIYTLYKFVYAK